MIGGEKLKQVEYKVKLYFRIMNINKSVAVLILFTFIFFGTCIGCIIKITFMDNEIQELKENNEEIVLHYENVLQNVNIENENLKDSVTYYKGMYDECVLLCDSLCEEIAVRDIKLARIAEYNRIAGQYKISSWLDKSRVKQLAI